MIWVHSLLIFCAGILAVVFRNGTYRFMGVRSWIGKQVCRYSSDRKENLKYLYPYEDVQKIICKRQYMWGTALYVGFILVNILAIVMLIMPAKETRLMDGYVIERKMDIGTVDNVTLYVSGGNIQKKQIILEVPVKLLNGEDKEKLFANSYSYVVEVLKLDNPSLDEIHSKLKLITRIPESSMTVVWHTDTAKTILDNGELLNADISEKGVEETLSFDLIYGDDVRNYTVQLHVFPPIKSEEEQLMEDIYEYTAKIGEASQADNSFYLPKEINGTALVWEEEAGQSTVTLLFAVVVFVFGGLALEKEREKEQLKNRKALLEEAYPELVHKIVLLTGAGMNMKNVLMTISADAEHTKISHVKNPVKRKTENQNNPLICEIRRMLQLMNQGISEVQVYESFGKRCQNASYLKLGTLMVQCTKKGAKGMTKIMADTADEAMMQKREYILRKGEQISTKLLLPMGLLLIVVMAVLIVPAFLSMNV